YLRKIAQLELARRRLRHSVRHDDLTGVLNRAGFTQQMNDALEAAAEDESTAVAVHVIDLDRFKDINETAGHALGDEVLRQISARIVRQLGTHEHLARLGADEFAILQIYPTAMPQAASALANDVARAIGQPLMIDGTALRVSASIGHAASPTDGAVADELMRAADVALQYAKMHARGRAMAFNASMEAERQSRFRIESRLRAALAGNEFDLHFQPVFESHG